jgi:hypothetical protein
VGGEGRGCGGKLCMVMVVVVGLSVYVTEAVRVGMSRAVRIGCKKLRFCSRATKQGY